MKVGVDGVLIGCWADAGDASRILDVGTGCGLIALIMAQRFPHARITGIDIDMPSIEEAMANVKASPWSDRVEVRNASFPDDFLSSDKEKGLYDFIVSNPPFFNSGITDVSTPRERARHQSILSPASLLENSRHILKKGGGIAMVIPFEESAQVEDKALSLGYFLKRKCLIRGHEKAPWKRVLLEWIYEADMPKVPSEELLTLESAPGEPTEEYRSLCKDFYLKF